MATGEKRPAWRKYGERSVEIRFLTEAESLKADAQAFDIPVIDLESFEIADHVLKIIPPDVAWEYRIVPVMRKQSALFIAMADPTKVETVNDIKFLAGTYVLPILAPERVITEALKKHYGEEPVRPDIATLATDNHARVGGLHGHARSSWMTIMRRAAGNLCLFFGALLAAVRLYVPDPEGWPSVLLAQPILHDWIEDAVKALILCLPISVSQRLASDLVSTVHAISVWNEAALTILFSYLLSRLIKG